MNVYKVIQFSKYLSSEFCAGPTFAFLNMKCFELLNAKLKSQNRDSFIRYNGLNEPIKTQL